ncbi:MAG: rlhE [Bacteriovoracaceae bacterium]|nr:rlhE [Bacteriovoracaceae bacterium]
MKSFKELSLPAPLARAIEELKFDVPTPIQASAIPIALEGKDLIGCAQTGTGKTAAFSIPLIAKIIASPDSRALILCPTRELATQVADVLRALTKHLPNIRGVVLIGGASMKPQMRGLSQNPSIIVATPGRLTDHLERKSLNLSKVNTIVLDEADRMFDMGFAPQVEHIFKFVPAKRQILLFSATLANTVKKLSDRYMHSPEHISVGEVNRPALKIKQSHISISGPDKNEKLLEVVKARSGAILIFSRTKIRTDRLSKFLKTNSVKAVAIHGGRTQGQRERALEDFRTGAYNILVATDVASRGLDIPSIELVVNFDLPATREDYIHRIGRTARAGANGEAISFVTPEEMRDWKIISGEKPESGGGGGHSHQKSGGGRKNNFRPRRGGFQRSSYSPAPRSERSSGRREARR